MANYKVFYAELVISRGLKLRLLVTCLKISLVKQQYTGARNAKHHYALPHVLKFPTQQLTFVECLNYADSRINNVYAYKLLYHNDVYRIINRSIVELNLRNRKYN